MGMVKWRINRENIAPAEENKWYLTVSPPGWAVGTVRGNLGVYPISERSSIVSLVYYDVSPERAVNILNGLIELYGTSTVDYKSRISANNIRFLDERLSLISDELNGIEKNLQTFMTSQGIVDLGTEGQLSLNQVKAADAKMGELDVQLDVLRQIEQYVTRRNSSNNAIPATLGLNDPVLMTLLSQLYETEFDLEKLRQTSGSSNPKIEVYEQAIAKLKPSINASINNLKVNIQTTKRQLQSENAKVMQTMGKIPQKQRLLLDISRQQGIKNAIYTFLLQKREEAAISSSSILPNYRVI
jgi:uncharacterized protein involved in exopolysaccharide biosynthesis